MKKTLLNLFAILTLAVSVQAQNITEGVLNMEITEATSDDPQMSMGIGMLKGATTTISFKGKKSVTEMDMMGGMMITKNYADQATNEMNMLMDAMGQKIWVSDNLDEVKEEQTKNGLEDIKVTYDKSDTKEILGFKAYKATISIPAGNETMTVTGYITEDIKTDATVIQGTEGLKLAGFPLEFTVNNPQMKLTISADSFDNKVDDAVFTPVTEGYTKMTMEEFSKTMGSMGGMGF